MTNYKCMARRIRACQTRDDFHRVEKSLERVYNVGAIPMAECQRLDLLALELRIDRTSDVI